MSRWRNLNQRIFNMDIFFHLEGLQLYLWILLNAMYEDGVQLGCVVLGERLYIRPIAKFQEALIFKVRMRPYCMRYESYEYEYVGVNMFKQVSDFVCWDYFYGVGMSVKKECNDSGVDWLNDKADSGLSLCGAKHVNRMRK
ncbi:hypothetical protein FHE72_17385 [Rossellomorea vietnamensis]|uniref:Uncharacterized protein n=1 Tax=Rossellomorea vietnamensis TaxID=218284 RepID=A0A6I6URQ3_9BACI|nr:hypothetical protein [Rossellomorea vietnamensis]QHE62599.1 hypothetical protein FHE72_17385 [Rossellomorea vietnamensis]